MASESSEGVVALPPEPPAIYQGNRERMQQARWLLLVMAALAIATGVYFYVVNDRRVEADLRAAEISWQGYPPEMRDADLKLQTGMTWDELVSSSRNEVRWLLGGNLLLALSYIGLWWWAKRNALRATATALVLYITVIVANAIYYDTSTLYKGMFIKLIFIGILCKAIAAAWEERKLQEAVPQARVAS